ncbi:hypothetical protein M972_112803 [Acetivibrio thermocellus AD2]|uniref:Amidohydrolase-related domain-containing protein n=1 Tax=Acetivibrio thermocellus AD2 TaxID=1138384 RepID=A0AB36TJD8_ACETH|nr:amidohydrolase family protein [Acetivibrio thermocellus]CDG36532.1 amidohydrolase 2 [Acetivibrio thermocellus BC1]ADU75679.1 amidohydrolase 2 [Acetivibrio thermocellus DSM 1313]ALX09701.1 amidohydrolase 2 [Acetivibrio thermocellus AD2]ANV77474.1 amidohydrolase 2 [Acetivibrio thermocellus DSM 2360]EIC03591.1 amidohydrolase 2 [Acetivibrio thermocellus YS]
MYRFIIDAHMHLPVYSGLETLEDKKIQLLADLERNKISAAVVMADSELQSAIGNNEECVNLFSDCDNVFVVAGISPLIDFQNNLNRIENYLCQKKIVGVKLYPGHEQFYLNDPRLESVFLLCEAFDVPVAVHTGWDNPHFNAPALFADIAGKHPKLKIVNCHLWYPKIDYCYEVTRDYQNIYYDISSLADDKGNKSKITEVLHRIANENPHRLIFGSDYGMCDPMAHIELVDRLPVSDETREMIFYKNAVRLYGLSRING